MNIQVNITLLIQCIHFCLAYSIVRFIVLKPAVALIVQKEKKNEALRTIINGTYILITREKEALFQQWREGLALHQQQMPTSEKEVFFSHIYPDDHYSVPSREMIDDQISLVSDALIKKMGAS